MFQTQLINQVVDWERRLEIEAERRQNNAEPYTNWLAPVAPWRPERLSLLARILSIGKARRSDAPAGGRYIKEQCCDTQPA